ncbi:MAG TPA: DUF364 domain-containing protein [Anaerolineales bacterium]
MSILDNVLATLPVGTDPVRNVLVGLHWTVVCSRHCGMAASLTSDGIPRGAQVPDVDRLYEQTARDLAELARSSDLFEASIGVAAINSLLDVDETKGREINAADVLAARGAGKSVALVGRFPFIERLRPAVGKLWVIELRPSEGEYPAESAADLLPRADVIAITGSAFVNHTLDGLLRLCKGKPVVMVLGPSTPLSPVLFDHGATIISGTRVVDEAAVLRAVSEGASFRELHGTRRLTFTRASAAQGERRGLLP